MVGAFVSNSFPLFNALYMWTIFDKLSKTKCFSFTPNVRLGVRRITVGEAETVWTEFGSMCKRNEWQSSLFMLCTKWLWKALQLNSKILLSAVYNGQYEAFTCADCNIFFLLPRHSWLERRRWRSRYGGQTFAFSIRIILA